MPEVNGLWCEGMRVASSVAEREDLPSKCVGKCKVGCIATPSIVSAISQSHWNGYFFLRIPRLKASVNLPNW